MSKAFVIVIKKDGKPVTPAFEGSPRAAYLGAIRSLGYDVEIIGDTPAEIAMTVATMGIELKRVKLTPARKRRAKKVPSGG